MPSRNLPLAGKQVVLGVAGGIAAYKAVEVCRRLEDLGAAVTPILTASALNFVGLATFRALASNEPLVDLFDSSDPIPHTRLGRTADLIVVAPATANLLGKFALGLADDALTTTLVASGAPVILAAAMHTEMWLHPAVVANVASIRARGYMVIDPDAGRLAGGDVGFGRLVDPERIVEAVLGVLGTEGSMGPLAGRRVLVTAGGTREAIDPVRYIGNRSSGKQGIAIAKAASSLGATGTVISTVATPAIPGFRLVEVESALEMHDAVLARLDEIDVLVMCAAVADFRVAEIATSKIKKLQGVPELVLVENPDILLDAARAVRERGLSVVMVGFAAETDNPLANAREKLQRKGVDLLVVNDVTEEGAGFGHDTNAVWILGADGFQQRVERSSKDVIARQLLDDVVELLGRSRDAGAAN